MNAITTAISNKKDHLVPSVITAALALAVAIPVTAVLSSNNGAVSAEAAPTSTTACTSPSVLGASTTSSTGSNGSVLGASTTVTPGTTTPGVSGNGNNNSGSNNGNTNTNGSGNGNGSGSNANGNTQTATGGLVGGVNAIVPVSALNGSLDDVLSHNNILSGNATSVSLLNGVSVPVAADVLSQFGIDL